MDVKSTVIRMSGSTVGSAAVWLVAWRGSLLSPAAAVVAALLVLAVLAVVVLAMDSDDRVRRLVSLIDALRGRRRRSSG